MNVFSFIVGMRTAEGILVKFDVGNETQVNAIQFSLKSYSNNATLYMGICMCFVAHLKCTYTLDIHRNRTYFRQALQRKMTFILRPVNLPFILWLPRRNKGEYAMIYMLRSNPTFLIVLFVFTFW